MISSLPFFFFFSQKPTSKLRGMKELLLQIPGCGDRLTTLSNSLSTSVVGTCNFPGTNKIQQKGWADPRVMTKPIT